MHEQIQLYHFFCFASVQCYDSQMNQAELEQVVLNTTHAHSHCVSFIFAFHPSIISPLRCKDAIDDGVSPVRGFQNEHVMNHVEHKVELRHGANQFGFQKRRPLLL